VLPFAATCSGTHGGLTRIGVSQQPPWAATDCIDALATVRVDDRFRRRVGFPTANRPATRHSRRRGSEVYRHHSSGGVGLGALGSMAVARVWSLINPSR
jgi:hypothetical protein